MLLQKYIFPTNAVHLNFLYIKESWKKCFTGYTKILRSISFSMDKISILELLFKEHVNKYILLIY